MSQLPLLILLALVVMVCSQSSLPVPRATGFCSGPGYKCDVTCQHLGMCSPSDSGYRWSLMKSCGSNYCDVNSKDCTSDATVCLEVEPNIVCITPGMYPNPYDCTRAYKCDPEIGSIPYLCPAGKRYNPCTKACDLILNNNLCPNTTYACTVAGDIQVVPENTRIYYICVVDTKGNLNPVLNQCADGFFDMSVRRCVPSTESGCGRVAVKVMCTTPGFKPDPENCKAYYYCNSRLQPTHILCSPGYRFVASKNGCSKGTC